jgi:hypothetical protein
VNLASVTTLPSAARKLDTITRGAGCGGTARTLALADGRGVPEAEADGIPRPIGAVDAVGAVDAQAAISTTATARAAR